MIPRVLLVLYSKQMALRIYERTLGSEGILMKWQFSPGFGTLVAATDLGADASLFNARVRPSTLQVKNSRYSEVTSYTVSLLQSPVFPS